MISNDELATMLEIVQRSLEVAVNAYTVAFAVSQTLEHRDPAFVADLKTRLENLDRQNSELRRQSYQALQKVIDRLRAEQG